ETLRPTASHRFYSESRKDWVRADELRRGESLRGIDWTVTVAERAEFPGVHRVYNMTVESEHVYRVSKLGVLVHNNCPKKPDLDLPEGSFSIIDWTGYPTIGGVRKPEGPFRTLEGIELENAVELKNAINRQIHDARPDLHGVHFHEVQ